jgi:hypothetical protein
MDSPKSLGKYMGINGWEKGKNKLRYMKYRRICNQWHPYAIDDKHKKTKELRSENHWVLRHISAFITLKDHTVSFKL